MAIFLHQFKEWRNHMKRKLLYIVILMAIIAGAAAIALSFAKKSGKNLDNNGDKQNLKLVATFYPVYLIGINLFDNIGEVEVKSLTDLDTGCLHDYQLTTQDMKNISEADILVVNGGGMEAFMEDINTNYPDLTVVDASKGIELYQDNPHVWLDPVLYMQQIENVRDGIIAYLESNDFKGLDIAKIKEAIIENAENYIAQVKEIDIRLEELKGTYGAAGKQAKAVIFHDSFAYIAKRIGIPVAYSIPLDHDTSLSAEEIANIIDDVNKEEIGYLFTEEQYSDSVARRIEAETTARVYIIDSAVTGDGSKESYIDAMERNIQVLKSALLDME